MFDELRKLLSVVNQYEHLTLPVLVLTMLVAVGCGLCIYLTYRLFYRGIVYSDNFGVLIVMVSSITAFIIITIGANLVLSLGMVGALSIVRFRAAIKEPLDVGFIYAAVAIGLTAGARLYLVAVVGTLAVCLVYIAMSYLRKEKRTFLLLVQYNAANEETVEPMLAKIPYRLKNRTVSGDHIELTAEVKIKKDDTKFTKELEDSAAVDNVMLVEYNGDYV